MRAAGMKSSIEGSSKGGLPEGILPGNIDGFEKKEFVYKFAVDEWYEALAEYTFETQILDLSLEEAKAIINLYRHTWSGVPLEDGNHELLYQLSERLEAAIQKYGSDGAFVKLNYRSPKDVVANPDNPHTRAVLRSVLLSPVVTREQAPAAWIKAMLKSLQVFTGKEALALLTSSSRIRDDLSEDIVYPEFMKSKLVVRKYHDLDPSLEFRAFVSNGHLTALSQYESGVYYPDLVHGKDLLENMICEFFEDIRRRIKLASYVIDFAVDPRTDRVVVVELNPFHANTSGCLFSWKTDREVILNGPFEFRVRERPLEDASQVMLPGWRTFIDRCFEEKEQSKHRMRAWFVLGAVVAAGLTAGYAYKYWRRNRE